MWRFYQGAHPLPHPRGPRVYQEDEAVQEQGVEEGNGTSCLVGQDEPSLQQEHNGKAHFKADQWKPALPVQRLGETPAKIQTLFLLDPTQTHRGGGTLPPICARPRAAALHHREGSTSAYRRSRPQIAQIKVNSGFPSLKTLSEFMVSHLYPSSLRRLCPLPRTSPDSVPACGSAPLRRETPAVIKSRTFLIHELEERDARRPLGGALSTRCAAVPAGQPRRTALPAPLEGR